MMYGSQELVPEEFKLPQTCRIGVLIDETSGMAYHAGDVDYTDIWHEESWWMVEFAAEGSVFRGFSGITDFSAVIAVDSRGFVLERLQPPTAPTFMFQIYLRQSQSACPEIYGGSFAESMQRAREVSGIPKPLPSSDWRDVFGLP